MTWLRKGFACAVTLALLCVAPVAHAQEKLVFSTLPFMEEQGQREIFERLENHLSEELGRPVSFEPQATYDGVINGLRSGAIDFALVGPVSYVHARRTRGVRVILRSIRAGKFEYRGVVFTKAGSGLSKIEHLKGKKVAFVDRTSASGYFYPRELMRASGVDPDRDIRVVFAGSHQKAVEMVASGAADAGAAFEGAEKAFESSKGLKVIGTTEEIPGDPVVVRAGLGRSLIVKLREAMMKLAASPDARPFFDAAKVQAFLPAFDSDYDGVAAVVER